ncbi:PREDICTED: breast cancer anti-estrogen resistance protein 1 [Galeopterus variegatus]|uniref:Breast cancer anti-estrogen resistance protein 1 n=1 Tax=Galeopterus variegatus TaxID=482537 RepID=A0ABM0R4A7_GALVR|nr:PREDICTED: breast cancer anti-estrogen resistance protein 1 [Galeopterus variegatus]
MPAGKVAASLGAGPWTLYQGKEGAGLLWTSVPPLKSILLGGLACHKVALEVQESPRDVLQGTGEGYLLFCQVPPPQRPQALSGMSSGPSLVVVPTRVGQGYVYEASQPEQDEYDIPRHLLAPGPQDIYDVPPVRGLLPSQYGQEVYDTPPMAVKGPNGRDPLLDVYDVPPSVEKGLPPSTHHACLQLVTRLHELTCSPHNKLVRKFSHPSPPKFTSQDSPDGQYENSEGGWMEDYDYVHLQGKEEFEKTQKELLEKGNITRQGKGQLELQQLKQFERLEQEVSRPIDHDLANWSQAQSLTPGRTGSLGPSDRQLLLFYLEQCEANLTTLTNAVDAFFTAVATNQPPKIFVAHSKFVILSAHKLVFIGDTLSRQAKAADVRSQVTHYSNLLCDLLRGIVATTKAAALQYPSPSAAQDMVDRVKELGHSTQQFRRVLGQLAAA